uniref:SSB-like protein n=1 Tax=unidentified TaxID=32644 RepID=Q9QUF5_9ZZZZ|nr:SSB-like protein [unidentified]
MNQVNLTGRLTKDIELRYTQSGKAVGNGTIAVGRKFKSENGERESDFINFVMWGKAAENFANYTHKGSQVGLGGEWQTRNYENNSGQRVYVNELNATSFDLLDPRGASETQSNLDSEDPFAAAGKKQIDISDDALPF